MASAHISLSRINLRRPPTSPTTSALKITSGVAQNLSYIDSIHSDIESYLKNAITIREPISVFEPMHHLTFSPPKTTASALCVAACEVVGGKPEDAIVAASAIHLMHATIYTHEHLLLTDRKPICKIPHRFGPNIELLTGDGIMPFGFKLLAGSVDPTLNNSDMILKVIIEITQAVGAQGMVDDQDHEVQFEHCGRQSLRLHGCGAACGAILGGGSEEEIERLKRYGEYAGKIQGLLGQIGGNEDAKLELAEKWRALALKELEYFDKTDIEKISTFCGSLEYFTLNKTLPYVVSNAVRASSK